MSTFALQDKIGDIVTAFPGASNVFKAYGIDFCCGGQRPLRHAVETQGLDGTELLSSLDEAYVFYQQRTQASVTDWTTAPYGQLIDHIIAKHHDYLRNEMPALSQFVTKVLNVHGYHHPEVLPPLHRMFHQLKLELEQHLASEEQVVFPLIRAYEATGDQAKLREAIAEIDRLEDEHTGAGDLLKEMREVTSNYTLPEDACRTFTLTYEKLDELEEDMFQHIHLENNILFVRLAKALQ